MFSCMTTYNQVNGYQIYGKIFCPMLRVDGSMSIRNVGKFLPDYTVSLSRRIEFRIELFLLHFKCHITTFKTYNFDVQFR